MVASCYGMIGKRFTATDAAILHYLRQIRELDISAPCLFGGDWNVEADDMTSKATDALQMQVVRPRGPTCFLHSSASCLDYFLITNDLAATLLGCAVDDAAATRPHRPVIGAFTAQWAAFKTLQWERRPLMPRLAPFGPRPAPSDWTAARQAADDALACAQHATRRRHIKDAIEKAYAVWQCTAVRNLARVTGTDHTDTQLASFNRAPRLVRKAPALFAWEQVPHIERQIVAERAVVNALTAIRACLVGGH